MLSALIAAGALLTGPLPPAIAEQAQEGDLLFTGGTGIWGRLAAGFSMTDQRFGHVGVLIRDGDEWAIIDAGGTPLTRQTGVAKRSLDDFLLTAEVIGLARAHIDEDARAVFLETLHATAQANTPFDPEFSLATTGDAYCTELIWRALSAATGEDAVPEKSRIQDHAYISLEDLLAAPLVEEIAAAKIRP